MEQEFSSTLLENAVTALSRLPGVGRKTALRYAFHLLRQPEEIALSLSESLSKLRQEVQYCKMCHNISEEEVCPICADSGRDHSTVCVVETVKDVMIIENTRRYGGVYHVLGGLVSPVDGVSPDMLEIASLIERASEGDIREVILATGATVEADTTNYYIYRQLSRQAPSVKVSQLARGVAIGNDLEYTDEATLARSLQGRTPFEL